jgi:peptide/nickel transport system permease protein
MAAQAEEFQGSLGWERDEDQEQAKAGERQLLPRKARLHLLSGGILVGGVILVALLAPRLVSYAPNVLNPDAMLLPPSALHPFGTDAFGRDLFSRVVYGSRLTLQLSFLSALIAGLPGILLGLLAGYCRGWIDTLLSRLVDAWLALPGLLLALLIIARTGPSLEGAILALGLTGIPGYFRLVRGGTISCSNQPYVEASRALGAGGGRLIFLHILPNLFTQIIVLTTLRLGTFLLAGSSLSFIGLGAKPPAPEWGSLLAEGRDYYDVAWWMFAFPMVAMTLTVLGFNLLGDGLRDKWAKRG